MKLDVISKLKTSMKTSTKTLLCQMRTWQDIHFQQLRDWLLQ